MGRSGAPCGRLTALVVAAVAIVLGQPSVANAAKTVDSFFPESSAVGSTGGLFSTPRDLAVNDGSVADAHDGWVYVVDGDNNRVQAFERLGSGAHEFRWAIGRDVIAPTAATDTDLGDVFERCTSAADCQAGSTGSATDGPGGELSGARSIAIDQQSGHLFVRERGPNLRIQEFTAAGDFVRAIGWNVIAPSAATDTDLGDVFEVCTTSADCQAATTTGGGAQAGQFGPIEATADNDNGIGVIPAGAPNAGHVIAADPGNSRIMEFNPDAASLASVFVRAWGWSVDSATSQFEICTAVTGCQRQPEGIASPNGRFALGYPLQIAIDSRGIVYATDKPAIATSRIMRFDARVAGDSDGPGSAAAQMLLPQVGPTESPAIEIDPDSDGAGTGDFDRLYLGRNSSGIQEYDVTSTTQPGTLVQTHMTGANLAQNSIGVNPSVGSTGVLYVTATSGFSDHRVYVLDDDGNTTLPSVTIDEPEDEDVTTESAHLTGTINPNGFPASYRFQYRQADEETWTYAGPAQAAGSGTSALPIEATLSGLASNTTYEARLEIARGYGNGTVTSDVVTFLTDAVGPTVVTYPPNQRGCTGATLAGRVNPNGSDTSYYFEYGPTAAYGSRAPVPDGELGAGATPIELSERVEGLAPGTTYHYRLVAENDLGQVAGDDVQFATRANCASGTEDRAYELVSPADDVSGNGSGTWLAGDLGVHPVGMPARSGERYVVSTTHGPTLVDGEFAYANDTAFAQRTESGWVSRSAFSRPNYGYAGNRFAYIDATSDELSLFTWIANGGRLSFFPEIEDWDEDIIPQQVSDWDGRFEILAPTNGTQGNPGTNGVGTTVVAADGSVAAMTTANRELFAGLSPDDPNVDRLQGARAAYVDDLSAGLTDTFPGGGDRSPVGVCDAGTLVPERVEASPGVFTQAAGNCAVGELVSAGGATLRGGTIELSTRNMISADGSKTFFQSPDPAIDPAACSGVGAETSCPTQLFVRADSGDAVATRWISRSAVSGQEASLLGRSYFEGATPDGDKVFFRSTSPLTADDPNGSCGAPCLTGSPDPDSWDLFVYDFTDSSADDPGAGQLTRISAGPAGDGDGNVQLLGRGGALRFVSDDGARVYFTSLAPLPGVPASDNGTSTAPGGTTATIDSMNLYLYDANRPTGDRYRFVARLPRSEAGVIASCATTAVASGEPLNVTAPRNGMTAEVRSCVHGSADGSLLTFFTDGALVAGDPDAASGDLYVYDAAADELERASAPRDGGTTSYPCMTHTPGASELPEPVRCWGDSGIGSAPLHRLGVATDASGESSAFFQSKSALVAEDADDAYDVYEWRGGELTLLTPGTPTGAYYTGNSRDGEDVFFMTRDPLTWQDSDATMDVYDARVGGGMAQPPSPTFCDVLAEGCQGGGFGALPTAPVTQAPAGADNADQGDRVTLRLGRPSAAQRRRAARTGVVPVRVMIDRAGTVRVVVRAKVGGRKKVVGRASRELAAAGATTVGVRLSKAARRSLRRGRRLGLTVQVASAGARPSSLTISLRRAGK